MLPKVICFVCGSRGAVYTIHIRQREHGSFFPFLENHDPPKGSRRPGADGFVDSCGVCYAFLNQQWDSYERSKTPLVKRLYWLKRNDDGAFTGAEMRMQGEYVAQMMWLENHGGDNDLPQKSSGISPYNFGGYPAPSSSVASPEKPVSRRQESKKPDLPPVRLNPPPPPPPGPPPQPQVHILDSSGALDLTVNGSKSTPSTPQVIPSIEKQKATSTEKESTKGREARNKQSTSGRTTIVCYICSMEYPSSAGRYIYAKKCIEDEPFFPVLYKLKQPEGAMAINKNGLTRVCCMCRKVLCQQWRVYESNHVVEEERVYQIGDQPIQELAIYGLADRNQAKEEYVSKAARSDVKNMSPSSESGVSVIDETCYLCGQVYHRSSMRLLYTVPPSEGSKHSMFFPFVSQLKRPAGARVLDPEGRVLTCRACYSYLQRQWQIYHGEGVPMQNRHFHLRPLVDSAKLSASSQASHSSKNPEGAGSSGSQASLPNPDRKRTLSMSSMTDSGASNSSTQPLNIDTSTPASKRLQGSDVAKSTAVVSSAAAPAQGGLLAIAPNTGLPMPMFMPGMQLPGLAFYQQLASSQGVNFPGVPFPFPYNPGLKPDEDDAKSVTKASETADVTSIAKHIKQELPSIGEDSQDADSIIHSTYQRASVSMTTNTTCQGDQTQVRPHSSCEPKPLVDDPTGIPGSHTGIRRMTVESGDGSQSLTDNRFTPEKHASLKSTETTAFHRNQEVGCSCMACYLSLTIFYKNTSVEGESSLITIILIHVYLFCIQSYKLLL